MRYRYPLDRLLRDESVCESEDRSLAAGVVTDDEIIVAEQLDVTRSASAAREALTQSDVLPVDVENAEDILTAHRNVETRAVARELL